MKNCGLTWKMVFLFFGFNVFVEGISVHFPVSPFASPFCSLTFSIYIYIYISCYFLAFFLPCFLFFSSCFFVVLSWLLYLLLIKKVIK